MREATSKFADFEHTPTLKAINSPLMLLFGFTLEEFIDATVVCLLVCAVVPGFYTPFFAFGGAIVFLFKSRKFRESYPSNYLSHRLSNEGIPLKMNAHNPVAHSKLKSHSSTQLGGQRHVILYP